MNPPFRRLIAALGAVFVLSLLRLPAATVAADRTALADSVRVPDASGHLSPATYVVRSQLTAAERAAPLDFSVTLRMRNFAELQARVAAGGTVSEDEMEARYRPLAADYARVAAWLAAQGFTARLADRTHTTVFVRGSVAQVQQALGLAFARVAAPDGEYTSAVSAPTLPNDLAPAVLAISGLQPEFRLRPPQSRHVAAPQVGVVSTGIYVYPSDVRGAYQVPDSADGAGQTVAIVGQYAVLASDVATFRSETGLPAMSGTLTATQVNGPSGQASAGTADEETLDVEWCGALAPAANLRQYLASDVFDCLAQILDDLPAYPSMRIVSMSFGASESEEGGVAAVAPYSQEFASLAAAGVSVFAASGDAGSNPTGLGETEDYSPSAPPQAEYPASDPSVTGVGGTTLQFSGDSTFGGEIVWNDIALSESASGGGVSSYYAKPSWQTGGAVLAGESMRCVPDVAAISDSNITNLNLGSQYQLATDINVPVLVWENGKDTGDVGTSLATPVWAGVAALINQSRAAAGLGTIGLLNPHLYPLQGTAALNDITSGSNGAYSAGAGYDLCTGLGSPNVPGLLAALGGQSVPADRLINLSSRAEVGTGGNIMIAGFVIDGPSGSTKAVLVRGIGPGLSAYGVTGVLATPEITVFDANGAAIASDSGWGNAPTAGPSTVGGTARAATAADMSTVGAFALAAGSADSAMVVTLPNGSYTVQVTGAASTTGVALAEVYELQTNVAPVLANLSTRCYVGGGSQIAIAGLVVHGTSQVLLRGVGPGLTAYGVTGVLAQPVIALYDSGGTTIATDTGWGNAPVAGTSTVAASYRAATAADMSAVGAFALASGSADSALVITLPAGSYTVQLSGLGSATGTALVEVYQISAQ